MSVQTAIALCELTNLCEVDRNGQRKNLDRFIQKQLQTLRSISDILTHKYLVHAQTSRQMSEIRPGGAIMKFKIAHSTIYEYSDIVSLCHNQVHLTPRDFLGQVCTAHRLSIKPIPTCLEHGRDYFGNHQHYFTVQEGHRRLSVTAISKVELQPPVEIRPEQTPVGPSWLNCCSVAQHRLTWNR